MKKTLLILVATIFFVSFSNQLFAQASADADAFATIVTPISITQTADLHFGNVAIQAGGGTGTVVLNAETDVRTPGGDVTLPATSGTVNAASFDVAGTANYTYAITLPSTDHTITDGTNTMIVNGFTSFPATTGTLDGSGEQVLKVGATLNVGANQPAGTYQSGTPFTVTVNYN